MSKTTRGSHDPVTDVRHEPTCSGARSYLFLSRTIEQVQDVVRRISPETVPDDGMPIQADGEWLFEQEMEPWKLRCSNCWASQYVAADPDENIVELDSRNCPRASRAWGHSPSWDGKPCEYCGYSAAKQSKSGPITH